MRALVQTFPRSEGPANVPASTKGPDAMNLPARPAVIRSLLGRWRHRLVLAVAVVLLSPGVHAASIAPISLIRGDLLAGRFRTQLELNSMSGDNQRDTLINELVVHT